MWSISFPGLGQLLNRKYIKGVLLIALEVIINLQSHLNKMIQRSFTGDVGRAIAETDYQWLMYYPCVYMFGIWDANRDADDELKPFAFLPFVFASFSATAGLIYSPYLLGPVWLALIFCFFGVGVGIYLGKMISN
ncbi:hypothetical protein [Paenibacillus anseongensis]|uniref:hypothetical protein n=1 Tax=Paenibacillus sp. CGMCC 1.16610 TaxID=2755557 RepID=UPI00215D74BA|nr:hypothetical protein [Paenibacillus sp. CGMCC 1.16610]